MEVSRQEYWSGLPFPSPGDLPNPEIELRSPALQAESLPYEPPGKSETEDAGKEAWICSLGWEDPLEEGVATCSSILARKISWTEEPGGLWSMGSQRVEHN